MPGAAPAGSHCGPRGAFATTLPLRPLKAPSPCAKHLTRRRAASAGVGRRKGVGCFLRLGLSRRPHQHLHSPLRCNQGARLESGVYPRPPVPHGRTHSPHAARRNGKRRPTARRPGDPQLRPRPSGPPEPGLRPVHHARPLRLKYPRASEWFAIASPRPRCAFASCCTA